MSVNNLPASVHFHKHNFHFSSATVFSSLLCCIFNRHTRLCIHHHTHNSFHLCKHSEETYQQHPSTWWCHEIGLCQLVYKASREWQSLFRLARAMSSSKIKAGLKTKQPSLKWVLFESYKSLRRVSTDCKQFFH